jgi:hypothetical protein
VYISVFYLLAAVILGSVVVTLWVAWLLKKDENGSTWIKRWAPYWDTRHRPWYILLSTMKLPLDQTLAVLH